MTLKEEIIRFKPRKANINMVDSRLVDYIQKASNYGYSKDQIKSILMREGWQENEIDMAFESLRNTAVPASNQAKTGRNIGFIISILSGFLIMLDGIILRTSEFLGFTLFKIIDPSMILELVMLSLIFGLGVILGSVLIYKNKNTAGGILVILMSSISMITFVGLIPSLIGIFAGILGILKK